MADPSPRPSPRPSTIERVQQLLSPYIKSRQEVTYIRRVLSLHLDSHIEDVEDSSHTTRLISLPTDSVDVKSSDSFIRGLKREYLKCLRANVRARQEYHRLSQEHEAICSNSDGPVGTSARSNSLDLYLALVKQRQKLERLNILQNHIEILSQKPAAAAKFLEAKEILKDVEPLPKVPEDVATGIDVETIPSQVDVNELSDNLEKAVLQARTLLKSERQLLNQVKARTGEQNPSDRIARLEALGRSRNALISWIEEELGKAGEIEEDETITSQDPTADSSLDERITSVKTLYGQYLEVRKALIDSVAGVELPPSHRSLPLDDVKLQAASSTPSSSQLSAISQYIRQLLAISSEQKALIQQKSHLSSNLSRQHKETLAALDRLEEESHLLPSYPVQELDTRDTTRRPASFGEAVGKQADTVQRAKAWSYAADSANIATKEAVLESVELGKSALEEARKTLWEEKQLLGPEGSKSGRMSPNKAVQTSSPMIRRRRTVVNEDDNAREAQQSDLWAILDGQLGMIKSEDV